jgi:predicted nucleic acid-binding protein
MILVDSDVLLGFFFDNDVHHKKSKLLLSQLRDNGEQLTITNIVIGEVITILSHRKGQEAARKFLEVIQQGFFSTIHIDEHFHELALQLFSQTNRKGTSYVDCCNAVVAKYFSVTVILSFDKAYPKDFGLQLYK